MDFGGYIDVTKIPDDKYRISSKSAHKQVSLVLRRLREPDKYGNEYYLIVRQTPEEYRDKAPNNIVGAFSPFRKKDTANDGQVGAVEMPSHSSDGSSGSDLPF